MKTRFRDSCSHLSTATIDMKYTTTSVAHPPTIEAAGGRFGGDAMVIGSLNDGNTYYVGVTLDSQQTWIARWARKIEGLVLGETIFRLVDNATEQCDIRITSSGTFQATRNGTVLGTSTAVVTVGVYHYLVVKIKIHSSTGTVDVYLDGISILSLTGQNTQNSGNATADRFFFQSSWNASHICDISVADGTGAAAENLSSQSRVYCVLPNGDGATLNFTPSTGTSHFALVDDVPPNTTDYNASSAAGDIDLLDYTNLSISGNALGLQVVTTALVDDAGSPTVASVCKSGGAANSIGTAVGVVSSYKCYMEQIDLDPNTSAAWAVSAIDSAKFGYKRVA